jgi:chemotaxis-related protein WspD
MTAPLPVLATETPCWHRIGVWGDRSCPELVRVTHCHNCPVFSAAGRTFLDAPAPPDYRDEWTGRLAVGPDDDAGERIGVLVFRVADEWLGLPVGVLVEVTHARTPHRIPHRGGLLAGVVNIRGELHLCARLDLLLGITPAAGAAPANPRMVVARLDTDGWVFAADEVDQVRRVPTRDVAAPAPTLARAVARLTRGVFSADGRAVGLLDEARVFQALRERIR